EPNPPYDGGTTLGPLQKTFQVDFIETPNVEDCGFTSTSECDDIFVVDIQDLMQTFDFEGITYTLQIFAFGLGELSDSACMEAGVGPGCFGLQTLENQATNASF